VARSAQLLDTTVEIVRVVANVDPITLDQVVAAAVAARCHLTPSRHSERDKD